MKNNDNGLNYEHHGRNHYKSWKQFKLLPKIIIKYEDLIEDSENNFNKIINFLE